MDGAGSNIYVRLTFDDVLVLLNVKPSNVSEEEAAGGVVRVGRCLGVLVVDAVVAGPVVDGALVGDGVHEHEEESVGRGERAY